jgi:C4-dicarboxylate transporter, DctQ subunit
MIDRIFGGLEAGLAVVYKIFVFVSSIMLIGLMFMMDFDLTARYFYQPVPGMTEITEIFLLYITFLGTAWLFKEDGHVVVDIVLGNLLPRIKRVFAYANYFFVGLTAFVLTWYGFATTYDVFRRGVRNPTILETPLSYIIVIIPIGSLMLFLQVLVKAWKLHRREEG